jgi:uncharacterized membrane protein
MSVQASSNSSSVVFPKDRFLSIDIIRGAIMLIMALDHVRHFLHLPSMVDEPTNLATTTPVLFFTRWITHFCAPVFIFLSGVSAFISGQRKTKREFSFFLIKRGCWLIVVELLIVSFSWRLDPLYHFFPLQVIWAIGWSMVILGLLVRTSMAVIAITGLVLLLAHNVTDYLALPQEGLCGVLWKVLMTSRVEPLPIGASRVALDIYAILPCTAIMLLGYALGLIYKNDFEERRRRRILVKLGLGTFIAFLLLRMFNQYGDPVPWSTQKNTIYSLLSFLNTTKYPVSLQYTCMTLGPLLILLSMLRERRGRVVNFLSVFGKVPFFYYLLHFFLIHAITAILFFAAGHSWSETNDPGSFIFFRPASFGINLGAVYIIWTSVIIILYFPCRWFMKYKSAHRQWWLSYV